MKQQFTTIAARNRVVNNILDALHERESFLIVGHKKPDEDCIASMVAFALLANKFSKRVTILLEGKVQENFEYLLRICTYNAIRVEYELDSDDRYETLVICDTAKPDLRIDHQDVERHMSDESVIVVEVDHHLGSDSGYQASPEYSLVDRATSAAELVGIIAFKLTQRPELLEEHQIREIFTRNIILAIVTGIIGDTKLGAFLQTSRERRMYRAFTEVYGILLEEKTLNSSGNFSSIEQVFEELERLSENEAKCYDAIWKHRTVDRYVATVTLLPEVSEALVAEFGWDTVGTVLRAIADNLAEESGYLSLVTYTGKPDQPDLVQFRARRSKSFTAIDLRDLLEHFGIENGGGHHGAIGFRVPKETIADIGQYARTICDGMNEMVGRTE